MCAGTGSRGHHGIFVPRRRYPCLVRGHAVRGTAVQRPYFRGQAMYPTHRPIYARTRCGRDSKRLCLGAGNGRPRTVKRVDRRTDKVRNPVVASSCMANDCSITFGTSKTNLVSNPINAGWILDGQPQARIELLSTSADGTASTHFWDCTAGRFNWFYSFDETFSIVEGELSLKGPKGTSRRVGPRETDFFPKGP